MNTNWKTKEEYIQFVADWKAAYKQLSNAIRTLKYTTRVLSSYRMTPVLDRELNSHDGNRFFKKSVDGLRAQRERAMKQIVELRTELRMFGYATPAAVATLMLKIRKEQKERAGIAANMAYTQSKRTPLTVV